MPAKDYELAVTGLTNTVWICKPSRRGKGTMTDDRVAVPKDRFIGVLLEWSLGEIEDKGTNVLTLTTDGKMIAQIKFNKKHPLIKDRFEE